MTYLYKGDDAPVTSSLLIKWRNEWFNFYTQRDDIVKTSCTSCIESRYASFATLEAASNLLFCICAYSF